MNLEVRLPDPTGSVLPLSFYPKTRYIYNMKNETASKAQPWLSKTPFQPRYEYLTARFKFLGVGKTQEFEYASFNGDVRIPWDTLPEMLKNLGENGWAISSHISISLGGMTLNGSGSGGYGVQQIVFCRPLETV